MLYAPIILFVYNRPEHTKTTLTLLGKNFLAKESDLFILQMVQKKMQQQNN